MVISSGTVLKVVASMLFPDSVIAQNVFNVVVTDLVTSDEGEDVLADCITWLEDMYTHFLAQIANDVTTSEATVYEYDSGEDDWDEVGTDTWSVTFTNANEMLPHGIAVVVHARTVDPDTLGTKYIGGFTEDAQNNSNVGAGVITDMVDFLAEWVTPFVGVETGGTFGPVIWSPTDTTPRVMSGTGYVNGQVGYQRRRKPGVGS